MTYNILHSRKLRAACQSRSNGAVFALESQPLVSLRDSQGIAYATNSRQLVTRAILPTVEPKGSPICSEVGPTEESPATPRMSSLESVILGRISESAVLRSILIQVSIMAL